MIIPRFVQQDDFFIVNAMLNMGAWMSSGLDSYPPCEIKVTIVSCLVVKHETILQKHKRAAI